MSLATPDKKKVTTHRLLEMKQRGEKISMLTGYDYTMAKIIDAAGIDVVLVGDSAANVMAGNMIIRTLPNVQKAMHGIMDYKFSNKRPPLHVPESSKSPLS